MSELLAYIVSHSNVNFISDLPLCRIRKETIASINAEQYSLSDWIETVDYLCKKKIVFTDVHEAKRYLLKQTDKVK